MTNPEINAAVARKLGWGYESDGGKWYRDGYKECMEHLPAYSTSIEAAWEILEKEPYVYLFKLGTGEWECKFSFADDPDAYIRADIAPLAICKAFLKLP